MRKMFISYIVVREKIVLAGRQHRLQENALAERDANVHEYTSDRSGYVSLFRIILPCIDIACEAHCRNVLFVFRLL